MNITNKTNNIELKIDRDWWIQFALFKNPKRNIIFKLLKKNHELDELQEHISRLRKLEQILNLEEAMKWPTGLDWAAEFAENDIPGTPDSSVCPVFARKLSFYWAASCDADFAGWCCFKVLNETAN